MELGHTTTVIPTRRLHLAMSNPPIAVNLDMPTNVDPAAYFTLLSAKIASDFELLQTSVLSARRATIALRNAENILSGDEMSERIAKIERSIEHLLASMSLMDAKLDKIADTTSEIKAGNAAIIQNFVEYDKKLDKKPSKDEVDSKITGQANKQITWSIASLLVIIGIASSIIIKLIK